MKTTRRFLCSLPICLLMVPLAHAQTATPATAHGTAIGQAINAAITAALPGVSAIESVVAALFKKPTPATATNTNVKVTPAQVSSAISAATTDGANSLQSNAQSQLSALQDAIAEIDAANSLATAARVANTSLPSKAFLNFAGGQDAFKTQWTVAKVNLNKLIAFDSTQLGKISDESLQEAWSTLTESYNQWINDVETNIVNQTSVTTAALTIGVPSFDKLATPFRRWQPYRASN